MIRFNPKELINDLLAEGFTHSAALAKAKEESIKRRDKKNLLVSIITRNNSLMDRAKIIPKIFT